MLGYGLSTDDFLCIILLISGGLEYVYRHPGFKKYPHLYEDFKAEFAVFSQNFHLKSAL